MIELIKDTIKMVRLMRRVGISLPQLQQILSIPGIQPVLHGFLVKIIVYGVGQLIRQEIKRWLFPAIHSFMIQKSLILLSPIQQKIGSW